MQTNRLHKSFRRSAVSLFLCFFVLCGANQVQAAHEPDTDVLLDQWFIIEIQQQRSGWAHVKVTRDNQSEDNLITTENEMLMQIARGRDTTQIRMSGRFIETADGQPISMWSSQQLSGVPIETTHEFLDNNQMRVVRKQGRETISDTVEDQPAGDWKTPYQVMAFTEAQLKTDIDSFDVRTVDPLSGAEPFLMSRTIEDRHATIEVNGKKRSVIRCSVTVSSQPGLKSTEYLDNDGKTVRSITQLGSFEMVTTIANRVSARRPLGNAPELLIATFVKPNRRIANPREVVDATMVLSIGKDQSMPTLPSAGGQKVEEFTEDDESCVRVTVSTTTNQPANQEDIDNETFLKSTVYLDHESLVIKNLTKKATRKKHDGSPVERAEAMRRFVHDHVRMKGLSVGFSTATETARSRRGDCSEHAVLLAALFRADGIPSRIVSGLCYVDQFVGERDVFGYHMWTQALIDGYWVDFDATIDHPRFDATHIAVVTSALDDDSMSSDLTGMIPLMGQLKITVEEVSY